MAPQITSPAELRRRPGDQTGKALTQIGLGIFFFSFKVVLAARMNGIIKSVPRKTKAKKEEKLIGHDLMESAGL